MKKIGLFIMLVLLFLVTQPLRAAAAGMPADGRYFIDAALSGGSGRAQIESPAELTVTDGAATAVIIWSSPYYTYMLIDGTYYYPVSTDGNTAFEIPVTLDKDIAVTAQTVAMSQPHDIDYTIYLDSATLKPLDSGASALPPLGIAAAAASGLVVLAAVFLIVIAVKKRAGKHEAAQ